MKSPLRQRALAGLAAGAVALSTAVAITPAASAAPTPGTVAAGQWLSAQLTNGVVHNDAWGSDDLGLSLDVLGALRELGVQPQVRQQVLATVSARVDEYVEFTSEGVTTFYPGSGGKLAIAVDTAGADPHAVGPRKRDLVADIEAVTDDATGESSDTYGLFGQTFATRGLIAGGSREAARSVAFVAAQQCANGSFRQNLTADCPDVPEIDTTAAALQTLAEARAAGIAVDSSAIERAGAAIAAAQAADGSFVGNGVPNTNSTGLAAVALSRAGRTDAARKAAAWVARHQVTAATGGRLASQVGAIAYDRAALEAGAADGIESAMRDQWLRASTQAAPALALLTTGRATATAPPRVAAGRTFRVTASGLAPGWKVTARVAGGSTASALVPASGRVAVTLKAPRGTARRAVTVADATGRTVATSSVRVLAAKRFAVAKAKKKVKRNKAQRIVVRGLVAGEPVRVQYRGKTVKRGVASAKGTYTHRFKVGRTTGTVRVVVRGAYGNRLGKTAFKVVR
ncbi:hypothetical protein AFL01nite_25560 [Aeromicrobium flavum]|uniref:Uncharacterized protein n=1 Tax=Aeromicrobium flavum TaxID=416568 RepID=A0A512HXQ7_9ACTN|nr:hypothetical protein [Aeromicrobium flavum]GEO90229.1 hypothetical protein AFL01nite_25560 [Aeromicrobium flavum]